VHHAKEDRINIQGMVAVGYGQPKEQRPDGDQDATVQTVPKQDQSYKHLQGVRLLLTGKDQGA